MSKRVIVIGGGAAGMLAAGVAAGEGKDVLLAEKNEKLGKKLYITGKGRCNLTNESDIENHIKNVMSNPYFMYSAYYSFFVNDIKELIEKMGTRLKVERGNRVFPLSDKSSDIIKALRRFDEKNGVKVLLNCKVNKLFKEQNRISGISTSQGDFTADSYIIATGGLSYPSTGSTGDGYNFAAYCGHNVTELYPSLVGLTADGFCRSLSGLSLRNVGINVFVGKKRVYEDFGELMFTHTGVSGPVILSASRFITKRLDENPEIYIDFKPALTEKELDLRLLRDFGENKNREIKNALDRLLPKAVIPFVIEQSRIDTYKKVNSISREERHALLEAVKKFRINVRGTEGFGRAVITCGGIDVKEIDPGTMRSKLMENLYFAGEVIDVDALTGGYNLQIAFSTGFLAGLNC